MKADYCTCSPDKVFGVYIGDICKEHDKAYETWHDCNWHRFLADVLLGWRISTRKIRLIPIGIIYFLAVLFFGGPAWRKHRDKNESKKTNNTPTSSY